MYSTSYICKQCQLTLFVNYFTHYSKQLVRITKLNIIKDLVFFGLCFRFAYWIQKMIFMLFEKFSRPNTICELRIICAKALKTHSEITSHMMRRFFDQNLTRFVTLNCSTGFYTYLRRHFRVTLPIKVVFELSWLEKGSQTLKSSILRHFRTLDLEFIQGAFYSEHINHTYLQIAFRQLMQFSIQFDHICFTSFLSRFAASQGCGSSYTEHACRKCFSVTY